MDISEKMAIMMEKLIDIGILDEMDDSIKPVRINQEFRSLIIKSIGENLNFIEDFDSESKRKYIEIFKIKIIINDFIFEILRKAINDWFTNKEIILDMFDLTGYITVVQLIAKDEWMEKISLKLEELKN